MCRQSSLPTRRGCKICNPKTTQKNPNSDLAKTAKGFLTGRTERFRVRTRPSTRIGVHHRHRMQMVKSRIDLRESTDRLRARSASFPRKRRVGDTRHSHQKQWLRLCRSAFGMRPISPLKTVPRAKNIRSNYDRFCRDRRSAERGAGNNICLLSENIAATLQIMLRVRSHSFK